MVISFFIIIYIMYNTVPLIWPVHLRALRILHGSRCPSCQTNHNMGKHPAMVIHRSLVSQIFNVNDAISVLDTGISAVALFGKNYHRFIPPASINPLPDGSRLFFERNQYTKSRPESPDADSCLYIADSKIEIHRKRV